MTLDRHFHRFLSARFSLSIGHIYIDHCGFRGYCIFDRFFLFLFYDFLVNGLNWLVNAQRSIYLVIAWAYGPLWRSSNSIQFITYSCLFVFCTPDLLYILWCAVDRLYILWCVEMPFARAPPIVHDRAQQDTMYTYMWPGLGHCMFLVFSYAYYC